MSDRDMFYNTYGYGGYVPMNGIDMYNNNLGEGLNTDKGIMGNNYMGYKLNDMNDRINRLERQVKRLDQRLNRLEAPYLNINTNQSTEPDNNMYMM